ncbi:MAG: protein-export chaperone SecB [Spirochaetaceae bacterium]|nr:protein-export chaperone SecB [Spirochaetaceae bacterium]
MEDKDFLNKNWSINFALTIPTYFKANKKYHVGIKTNIELLAMISKEDIVHDPSSNPLISLEASISGLFSVKDFNELDSDTVDNIVKYQFPTLLLPYLRGTVTSFLANAGFGTFIFPLVNMAKLSSNLLKDTPISVVE